jgi:hypothetical protein
MCVGDSLLELGGGVGRGRVEWRGVGEGVRMDLAWTGGQQSEAVGGRGGGGGRSLSRNYELRPQLSWTSEAGSSLIQKAQFNYKKETHFSAQLVDSC